MNWFSDWLRGFFFPRKCMLCRRILAENETDLCHSCRIDTEEYPYSTANPAPKGKLTLHFLDSYTAVWYYEDNVRRSILRYKFYRAMHLAPKFGRILAMRILRDGPRDFDILTWVPTSRWRRLRRGYDQCELLAQAVGQELNVPAASVLKKIRHTPPQSRISQRSARKANVLGAFAVEADVQGKSILLLDDIYTTGATSEECARMLLIAGAKEVHCATIAAAHKK